MAAASDEGEGVGEGDGDGRKERRQFGQHAIRDAEVFYETRLSFAFVNLRPLLPGHVLVAPRRVARRVRDLSAEETSDLFNAARVVGAVVEDAFEAKALTFIVQDGEAAGQSVFHVHVHVIPRGGRRDFDDTDKLYAHVEEYNADNIYTALQQHDKDGNNARPARAWSDMAEEAGRLRQLMMLRGTAQ